METTNFSGVITGVIKGSTSFIIWGFTANTTTSARSATSLALSAGTKPTSRANVSVFPGLLLNPKMVSLSNFPLRTMPRMMAFAMFPKPINP